MRCQGATGLSKLKTNISNGWVKRIVDPDSNKLYTQRKAVIDQQAVSESDDVLQDDVGYWPKGPYTQQIKGVLSTFLTEKEAIMESS